MEFLILHQMRLTRNGIHVAAVERIFAMPSIENLDSPDNQKVKVRRRITPPAVRTGAVEFYYDPYHATTAAYYFALRLFLSPI